MSRTLAYARMHAAFADAARAFGVAPVVARVALAVSERPGQAALTDELEADLLLHGSMVRRAVLAMYAGGLAVGRASNGGPRRPGLRTEVRLTSEGRRLAALAGRLAA